MSYQSEVLADSPLAYWRLDDLTGTVMTDTSGNGHHGTFHSSAVLGIVSAIETDASSRALQGGGRSLTAPKPTGNFTMEGWGIVDPGGAPRHIVTGAGQAGASGGIFINTDAGVVGFRFSTDGTSGTTVNLSAPVPTSGIYYHVVATRNGTVLRLYLNGVLVDEETGVSAAAITSTYTSVPWQVGIAGDFNLWGGLGTDEAAVYDHALSAARVLAHYEAAKASLPLRATIVINLGLELNTDQITPTDLGFAHNFSSTFGDSNIPIVETLEFKTNSNKSEPDYEQRISARPHGPLRSLEYHLSPTSGAARARLQGHLYAPAQFYTLPIWSDASVTTAQASAGASSIACDTTKRDYQALSYCGVCTNPQDPSTYQFFQITSVADAALTLATTIGTTIPSGSIVFPARVASISDDTLSIKSFAADHEDTTIRFEIIESELSTRRITTYTPATSYLSTEVFSLEAAKVSFLDERPLDITRRMQARGRDYQYAIDTGSPQTFPVRFLLTTRVALSEFFGWLGARQGRLSPLWVSTKERDLIPSAGTGSAITVAKTGLSLHHGRRHLEFLKTDGTFTRARVTGVTDNSNGTETWTVTSPLFADIARVSFLKYCVLGQDTVILRYFKGGSNGAVIAECGLSFKELLTSPS